jgi:hypothetical protein
LSLLLLAALGPAQAAQFVYEGRLDDRGQPANGRYDLKITAFGQAAGGTTLAAPVTVTDVAVKDGQFRVELDLPLVATDQVWLEVALRGSGEPGFSAIPGRSKAVAAPLIGACWSTTGDSGSDPATHFIGTTDNQPFVVRTQNAQSLRIEPSGELFNGQPITTNTIAGSSANSVTFGVRGATIAGGGVPAGDSDPNYNDENPNRVTDHYGTVGGGYANRAGDAAGSANDRPFATVGGGFSNTASSGFSTVGGGDHNTASGDRSTVGGGNSNTASGVRSTVGGGESNTASGFAATVGGGYNNTASGDGSAVGGGYTNTASGVRGTVGGGGSNTASGNFSTVGGGWENTASADWSTVGGGSLNCAGGRFSWAGGRRAKVRPAAAGSGACSGVSVGDATNGDQGTFVWADSQDADFVSTGPNQFLVRAAGGFGFNTNTIPSNRFLNTSTGAYLSTGGVWNSNSSRTVKEGFNAVDPLDVLNRLLALPITTWQYIGSSEGLHMGPVAEDFQAAFGLAGDGKTIATVDADGVAMAAIQGLNAKLEAERDALLTKLEAENTALRAESAELRARLQRLEALVIGRGIDKEH